MAYFALCLDCDPRPLEQFFPDVLLEVKHCYGSNDYTAPEGIIDGFYCSCECKK